EASVYLHQRRQNFIEDLFEQGATHPDRPAVVDQNGARTVTYEQFVSLIRKTASKIKSLQLTPHSYIIINMGRCMEYHAAMYAVVLSGHAFISLVPDTPQAREAYIRQESESEFTIRETFFDDIDLYEEYEGLMPEESDPAMMLYTSGSTGRPKGVYYTFGVLSRCYQYAEFILEDIDPIIYASSIALSFAAIAVDTFHIYCRGGTMHILSDDVRKDINRMNAYYREHGITCGNVHPRLHRYLDGGDQLKRIFTSGHRITDFYSDRFETILGYGLAETFAVPTYFRLDRAYTATPVGHAHGGYTVMVCDSDGNEVPDGTQGEVRIKGDIACGYFKMPELTAETFEKQPDGTVLLHTHDIGYKDENGNLVLLNRDDWLVKINGMSVNPAEIDYAMSHIPGIRESAAKGFTDGNGNSYICDYYVTDDDTLTPEVLKEHLQKTLMPYMIPAAFVRMDRLPQTISSKVDYTALQAPERFRTDTLYEAPADEIETRICSAYDKVLGRNRIGRNDDFFESGGDSLSLIELLAVLDDPRLSLADIAALKTPKALAELLRS
ncbi:MAG: non-ribosomal peptide synthetase, partial [Solobacterium sp.]|nr:non-ribosomal peptide synthetase [Solobacterium sp.]